jgi:hypothetical protein
MALSTGCSASTGWLTFSRNGLAGFHDLFETTKILINLLLGVFTE